MFADDVGISIGDTAAVKILAGRVGQLGTNGIWNDIEPGTQVEYYVRHAGIDTNKVVEIFQGA